MFYFSLLDLIIYRSNEHSIQESNGATHRWWNTEKDGTAPESSETSNQPSHFMKFEKTQLSFFLCVKRDTAKNATELEVALTSCFSTVDVA